MSSAVSHHGGLIVALVALANGLVWLHRGNRLEPEKRVGYVRLVRGLVLGVGLPGLLGELSTVEAVPALLREAAMALAVGFSLAAVCLATLWIYFLGGAKTLAEHPGLFTSGPTRPLGFKIVWGLLVVSIIGGYALSVTRP